ncbi:hypothetical protein GAO09_19125 [Rhizobiales bacterium RZME27]|uniref:Uncharacterized protein n=1 Tax=Endobacterium cereale TaxID=2663029 RepID=A0A6A8AA57_9HYPH|nr:hypothetical protein [Endobacterium cereale]MQY48155.1 hypothetical protein [Endobacterium cereale]
MSRVSELEHQTNNDIAIVMRSLFHFELMVDAHYSEYLKVAAPILARLWSKFGCFAPILLKLTSADPSH